VGQPFLYILIKQLKLIRKLRERFYMASKKPVHTVRNGDVWANKQGGKTISTHRTKANAATEGRRQAKRAETEHVIHNSNGQIGEKNSYGNDPCPPTDKN